MLYLPFYFIVKEAVMQTFLFQQKTALAKKSDCLFAKTSLKRFPSVPRLSKYRLFHCSVHKSFLKYALAYVRVISLRSKLIIKTCLNFPAINFIFCRASHFQLLRSATSMLSKMILYKLLKKMEWIFSKTSSQVNLVMLTDNIIV